MFRFTIRELVLLTIIVAMGVGWWLDGHSWRARPAPPSPPPTPPPPGRYQVVVSEGTTMVMDTATGELWSRPKGYSKFSQTESPWRKRK